MINLIRDRWLPVRLTSGESAKVRPADIVGEGSDVPVALDAARPDYNGSLIQILVGLYQTFLAPETEDDWWEWFQHPPTSAELLELLEPWAHAFELVGEHAFMQDEEELPERFRAKIDCLHLTAPGNQTLNHNKDLFLKRNDGFGMCPTCVTAALAAAQFNATAGGPGFRTSVRGGGPVTTILRGSNLWHDVWLNVIPKDELRPFGEVTQATLPRVLPWMGPCRESSKNGVSTTTEDVSGHQVYWGNSKRLQLEAFQEPAVPIPCSVCGEPASQVVTEYRELRYGTNYVGPWIHPLTPYTFSDKPTDDPNPLKGSPDGFAYKHWRGIVTSFDDKGRRPARTVHYFRRQREREFATEYPDLPVRVWAFGYDADNAKIRSWDEGLYPLVAIENADDRQTFDHLVSLFIEAADEAARALQTALKQALYAELEITSTGKKKWNYDDRASTDKALFVQSAMQFWRATESSFYANMLAVAAAIGEEDRLDDAKKSWLQVIERASLLIFDETSAFGNFRNADPKTSSIARNALRWAFRHSDVTGSKDGYIAKTLSIRQLSSEQGGTDE